jgi:hypothetical protein
LRLNPHADVARSAAIRTTVTFVTAELEERIIKRILTTIP